jgi:hypothetical protein
MRRVFAPSFLGTRKFLCAQQHSNLRHRLWRPVWSVHYVLPVNFNASELAFKPCQSVAVFQ